MGSFFTVTAVILILVPAALEMELARFLNRYAIPTSVILWVAIIWCAYRIGRKEEDPHERSILYSAPFCLLPTYCFIMESAYNLMYNIKGFDLFFALLEIPFSVCVIFLLGAGIGWLANRFRKPVVAVPLTAIGNVLLTLWIMN